APNIASIVVRYPGDQAIDYAGLEAVARGFLPKQTPFVLLAESFSGPIALAIAAAPPANLKGLILTCAFARNPRPGLRRLQAFVPLLPIGWVPTALLAGPLRPLQPQVGACRRPGAGVARRAEPTALRRAWHRSIDQARPGYGAGPLSARLRGQARATGGLGAARGHAADPVCRARRPAF